MVAKQVRRIWPSKIVSFGYYHRHLAKLDDGLGLTRLLKACRVSVLKLKNGWRGVNLNTTLKLFTKQLYPDAGLPRAKQGGGARKH